MMEVRDAIADVFVNGAGVYDDLARKYTRRGIDRHIRKRELDPVSVGGRRIMTLTPKSRQRFGITNVKRPSPASALDSVAHRLHIDAYQANGWTFEGKYAQNILRFSKAGEIDEFVLAKRSDYHPKSVTSLLGQYAQSIAIEGGLIVTYVRDSSHGVTLKRAHKHRIIVRDFENLLAYAHPYVKELLKGNPA